VSEFRIFGGGQVKEYKQASLANRSSALPLLVARIIANYVHHASASDDFAVVAQALNTGADFHIPITSTNAARRTIRPGLKAFQYMIWHAICSRGEKPYFYAVYMGWGNFFGNLERVHLPRSMLTQGLKLPLGTESF
jgi:hypothetical protein